MIKLSKGRIIELAIVITAVLFIAWEIKNYFVPPQTSNSITAQTTTATEDLIREKARIASEKYMHRATILLAPSGESTDLNDTMRDTAKSVAQLADSLQAVAANASSYSRPERRAELKTLLLKYLESEDKYITASTKNVINPLDAPKAAAYLKTELAAAKEARKALQELIDILK